MVTILQDDGVVVYEPELEDVQAIMSQTGVSEARHHAQRYSDLIILLTFCLQRKARAALVAQKGKADHALVLCHSTINPNLNNSFSLSESMNLVCPIVQCVATQQLWLPCGIGRYHVSPMPVMSLPYLRGWRLCLYTASSP